MEGSKGTRYPLCLQGQRACPPDGVGGVAGYQEYLEAMADFDHEQHEGFMEWRGRFDPETFDPLVATARMQSGVPERREAERG